MLKRMASLVGAFLILATAASAVPTLRVTYDGGGIISNYIEKYQAVEEMGGLVMIDGACISACTLVTALVTPSHVCVTRRAFLAFHSATQGDQYSEDGTQLIWHMYPEHVRMLLVQHGWTGGEHPSLIFIQGAELRTIYQPCPN